GPVPAPCSPCTGPWWKVRDARPRRGQGPAGQSYRASASGEGRDTGPDPFTIQWRQRTHRFSTATALWRGRDSGVQAIGKPVKKYLCWSDVERLVDQLVDQIPMEAYDV